MDEAYEMIPVKSSTKVKLRRDLEKLTVERGGRKTSWDDLINDLRRPNLPR